MKIIVKRLFLLSFLFFGLTAFSVKAAAGDVDAGFAPALKNARGINAFAVQTDGKIVIGGTFTTVNGKEAFRVARLNADGSLDTAFSTGTGINSGNPTDGEVTAIAVQTDGRILVAGLFFTYNGTSRNNLLRLNSDGSLDTSFTVGNGPDSRIFAITLQSDNKILIGGQFNNYNGTSRKNLARLNADGSLDTAFDTSNGPNGQINGIVIQTDGQIIIGGNFTQYGGVSRNNLARVSGTNAALDASYNNAQGPNSAVNSVVLQSNGKAVISGFFTQYNLTSAGYVARINTDGTLDTAFNSGGSGAGNIVFALLKQSDDKIYLHGFFFSFNGTTRNRLARLNADGSLDATFDPGAGTGSQNSFALAQQPDGKLLAAGDFKQAGGVPRYSIARFDNTTGAFDPTLEAAPGLSTGSVYEVAVKPNGKIVAAGSFEAANQKAWNNIAQFNSDGTTDSSFNPGSGANSQISVAVPLSDNKILIGGNFTTYNGLTCNYLTRLNADGTRDTTFNSGGAGPDFSVNDIFVQTDGKIVIGGIFTSYNGITRNRVARLNADGTLDTAFNAGIGPNNQVFSVAVQSDGKVLMGGQFTAVNNDFSKANFVRLNANGTLDAGYNNLGAGANSQVRKIVLQTDGKPVIGGDFTAYNGTTRNFMARVNTDGTLDNSFTSGSTGSIYDFVVQADGKFVIVGTFGSYSGNPRLRIARINSDGSLDTVYNTATGADSFTYGVALQSNGFALVSGQFSKVNNVTRFGLVRLDPGATSVWTGAVSNDWNNTGNWAGNLLPTNIDSVIIPSGALPNEPSITVADVNIGSLSIGSGHTVTVNSPRTLTSIGLLNNGTLTGGGTMSLTGASFSNNGTISVSTFQTTASAVNLSGTGSFTGTLSLGTSSILTLNGNHQFGAIQGTNAIVSNSFNLILTGGGAPLAINQLNLGVGSTVTYQGTAQQTIFPTDYQNLTVNNPAGAITNNNNLRVDSVLTLTNGTLNVGTGNLLLTTNATATSANGYVIGSFQKQFNGATNFTYYVGTASGSAPVTLSNIVGTGSITVTANNGTLAGAFTAQSLTRNWTLQNGGLTQTDLTFQYQQTDVPGGANESLFKFLRRSGLTTTAITPSSFDTITNTFTLNGVTTFSDWGLGQLAPTAANVGISGRVLTAGERGISRAVVSLIDTNGNIRYAMTSPFGFYYFTDVPAGGTYIVAVRHKHYQFQPQVITVTEDISDLNFIAQE